MRNRAIIIVVGAFLFAGCDSFFLGETESPVSIALNLSLPPMLNDGWDVSTLADEGVVPSGVEAILKRLTEDPAKFHSLLIIKNGKLVTEAYFGGWHRARLQSIRSDSKSITSTLIGIAVDQKKITSLDERLFSFFPAYEQFNTEAKNEITLEDVLTMRAGLQWNQTTLVDNDEDKLDNEKDGFRYILSKKLASTPGEFFNYSSGCSDLLTGVLHHATGMHADVFAEEYLFKPLQIKDYGWRKLRNGFPNAGYGVHMYPRDMAKIGQLFLDSGLWNGERIISREWVKQSTSEKVSNVEGSSDVGYGYQWWVRRWQVGELVLRSYQAQGNGGQIICVLPELNCVVVLTGAFYDDEGRAPYNLLEGSILRALTK